MLTKYLKNGKINVLLFVEKNDKIEIYILQRG